MNTAPLSQLVLLGLSRLPDVPNLIQRAAMLRAAAPHVPADVASHCEVTAAAIELAEKAQLELHGLISGSE